MKLNNISRDVFFATDLPKEAKSEKVRVCSAEGREATISRDEIVASGRLVACEYVGGALNSDPNVKEKYVTKLNSVAGEDADYATIAKNHKEALLLFCASVADRARGRDKSPTTFDEFRKVEATYRTSNVFIETLAAVSEDVLRPIFFNVLSDVGMGLMDLQAGAMGQTRIIDIPSNDAILFEDSSFGSINGTTKTYLYPANVALTPKAFAANATIKWYQDIVNGDIGRYYAAIIRGMYSKMYAILMQRMKAAVSAGTYIPSGLTYSTYTTANWIALTDKVAAANGIRVSDLMAIGTRTALSRVLPVDGSGALLAGLTYGLGRDWFENGFLPNAAGVDLFPVTPAIVPNTQNSTLDTIDTGDSIYVLGKGNYGYKPIMGIYAEGTPLMLSANPLGATGSAQGTADVTININVSAFFDIAHVFASKVGVMTSVYPA